ncbi:unnamed protein product [Cylindrotheca closterium]|uniref:guanylate cyclase n=1 Tax=Cylindrotheca closterium TaxID=2856 RepID=A0AAD2GE33_9STRA|nr:unnamed protein product [Cylindrotheca closterium]
MYGLIFEVLEDFVVDEFGTETWHKIKEIAGCKTKDQAFLRRAFYEDEELFALVEAATKLLHVSSFDVLKAYGRYFLSSQLAGGGYTELLRCQGATLRQWLSNLNALHEYIKRSFPGEGFIAPVFWCEDCEDCQDNGSILLHYYSMRGTMFVPLVVGIVEELAIQHFDLEVNMNQTSLQGEDGATFTTWQISAVDKSKQWKLSPRNEVQQPVNFDKVQMPSKCPFSGRKLKGGTTDEADAQADAQETPTRHQEDHTATTRTSVSTSKCPFHHGSSKAPKEEAESSTSQPETAEIAPGEESLSRSTVTAGASSFKFELEHLARLFPFHILVDGNFSIINVGEKLSILLQTSDQEIQGLHIGDIVEITRPVMVSSWDWKSLNKLSDQNFFLTPTVKNSPLHNKVSTADAEQSDLLAALQKKVSMADSTIRFKASMFRLSSNQVLFTLAPDARNVTDLQNMGLTLSDLPLASCQRDAVFLGEHVAKEASRAHKLDKLTKKLAERDVSKLLLNSMLPQKVAEDLIRGKTVEPAFHEHVTLFFSDVVGFTSICDQVEPWDVIDMMNQLYSVMDFLASHFDLYKVETVGDSYMCASGLINPDDYHAEKMANFALAVQECVQHVKSPIDGSPIQLRIGIHTGSCTSGIVGTLAPHYCLFGDMVNTASRHESTGLAGKIQCSSVLYDRVERDSKKDSSQYKFRARGLVDMKGKGECYTYWLESATEENPAANEESLASLSRQVLEILGRNSWKKRRYFERGGEMFHNSPDKEGLDETSTEGQDASESSQSSIPDANASCGRIEEMNGNDCAICPVVVDLAPEKRINYWKQLHCDETSSQSEMGSTIFDMLMTSLESCTQNIGIMQEQLRAFVSSIANIYLARSERSQLHNITQTLFRCNSLWEARDPNERSPYALGANPWDHFTLLFSAFIHRVKHTGSTNATLEREKHIVAQMYEGLQSCQERRSADFAFTLLETEFGELYDEITFGCPNFTIMVRKAVLCTDLENENTVREMLGNCAKLNSMDNCADERQSRQRNTANIGLILAVATVGQCTQSLDQFLQYCGEEYDKAMKASDSNSAESWYYEQSMFMKDVLLPLIEEVLPVLPLSGYLEEGAAENIAFWDKRGQEWMVASKLKKAKLHGVIEGSVISKYQVEKLVSVNVATLETLLTQVMTTRNGNESRYLDDGVESTSRNPYEEIQMFIEMKKSTIKSGNGTSTIHQVGADIRSELRDFVVTIVAGYESNQFHNFLHASHVAHMANLLVKCIHSTEGSNGASNIAHDPLARFVIVLSALVHDIGHTGVPNSQLAEEQPELADKYSRKSIAEQNSIDTAWEILMSPKFKKLQCCLFESKQEKARFRQLLVNCVMATDIFDQDLRVLRQSRWEKVFSGDEEAHCKATSAIEHIMQTSDVAHTMQDWEIYCQWNESLYRELHDAYTEGRSTKDPSDGWYEGELWFFDHWVIPLAQNLKACGVLDIVSDQLVKQARSNRRRWQLEGKQISQEMCSTIQSDTRSSCCSHSLSAASEHSGSSASYLASQMVTEAESVSKVMARYERKYEAVLGNLIALAYKGQLPSDLEQQELSDVHKHFKDQDWYRSHADNAEALFRL